jgi:hypothetical protein
LLEQTFSNFIIIKLQVVAYMYHLLMPHIHENQTTTKLDNEDEHHIVYCAKLVSPRLLKNVARNFFLPRNNVTFSQIARNIGD